MWNDSNEIEQLLWSHISEIEISVETNVFVLIEEIIRLLFLLFRSIIIYRYCQSMNEV